MTTYNTRNPLGSAAVKDLFDNAQNLDDAINDRQSDYWEDRFGVPRLSWYGIERLFQEFLLNSGYQDIGEYDAGLTITTRNQTFWRDGEIYRAAASLELPYTTTGVWAEESGSFVAVGDQVLRQQLAEMTGAAMVAFPTGQLVDEAITHFETIADLRTMRPKGLRSGKTVVVNVSCHTVEGDGGGGRFRWQYNSNQTDDNGTVIGSGDPGRWIRIIEGPVYAEWFGARADLTADSSDAFQAASDYVGIGGAWLWRGVHRVTKTITIPRRQSFGSFGKCTSFNPGNLTNWQGPNTPQQTRIDHGVFFDPPSKEGVLFQCEEAAEPHDFTAYSLGYTTIGSDVSLAQQEANHYVVHAFRMNKYIRSRNVTVALFHTAYLSEGFDGEQGNFYSSYESPEIMRCFAAYRYGSVDPYNQRIINPRIALCSKFMDCAHGLRNMTIHGGSIEGWKLPSGIRGAGSLAIFGTYFETTDNTVPGGLGALFYITSAAVHFDFSYYGGMCYLNNVNQFVRAEANNVTFNSNGNTFIKVSAGQTAPSTQIYFHASANQPTADGMLIGDRFYGDTPNVAYTNHLNFGLLSAPRNLVASGLNLLRSESTAGISLSPQSSAPANPQSGAIYLANGGSWNPLSRSGGYAYFVCWRGGWEAV